MALESKGFFIGHTEKRLAQWWSALWGRQGQPRKNDGGCVGHPACEIRRMMSCGRDNIRLWRVRNGALRSCPVNLREYHALAFTDMAFEEGHFADCEPEDRTLFASSRSGHILEIDYKTVVIRNVRWLLPAQQAHSHRREKQIFSTGPGIAVNSISISSAFCATGSEDGYLRLWPLYFSTVFLEAGILGTPMV